MQPWRWTLFMADLDPIVGSEQAGRRPILVVSEEHHNQILEMLTVVPITSRKRGRRVHPDEMLLPKGPGGLDRESIALVHQVRAISKRRLLNRLGSLDDYAQRRQMFEALREHFDLDEWLSDPQSGIARRTR